MRRSSIYPKRYNRQRLQRQFFLFTTTKRGASITNWFISVVGRKITNPVRGGLLYKNLISLHR